MTEIILPLVILGLVVVEIGLILTINRRYFSLGVPLYRRRVSLHQTTSLRPSPEILASRLSKSVYVPFLFRQFSGTEYGFREGFGSFFKISYPPIMRGFLTFDSASQEVMATGYANLWMCALLLYMAKQFLHPRDPEMSIFFVLFVALCFGLQVRRFRRVAEVAGEEWANPMNVEVDGA